MKTYEAGESIHQINAGISHPSTFTAKKLLIYEQNYSFFETICVNVYQVQILTCTRSRKTCSKCRYHHQIGRLQTTMRGVGGRRREEEKLMSGVRIQEVTDRQLMSRI